MDFVCARARQDVTVALIGQGPDELLGGYTGISGSPYSAAWRKISGSRVARSSTAAASVGLSRGEALKRRCRRPWCPRPAPAGASTFSRSSRTQRSRRSSSPEHSTGTAPPMPFSTAGACPSPRDSMDSTNSEVSNSWNCARLCRTNCSCTGTRFPWRTRSKRGFRFWIATSSSTFNVSVRSSRCATVGASGFRTAKYAVGLIPSSLDHAAQSAALQSMSLTIGSAARCVDRWVTICSIAEALMFNFLNPASVGAPAP